LACGLAENLGGVSASEPTPEISPDSTSDPAFIKNFSSNFFSINAATKNALKIHGFLRPQQTKTDLSS